MTLASGTADDGPPTVLRAETRWIPAADGSRVEAESRGFVVTRELQRVQADGAPARRLAIDSAGETFAFTVGEVVEDHVQMVNPKPSFYVAVVVPLAAGLGRVRIRGRHPGERCVQRGASRGLHHQLCPVPTTNAFHRRRHRTETLERGCIALTQNARNMLKKFCRSGLLSRLCAHECHERIRR